MNVQTLTQVADISAKDDQHDDSPLSFVLRQIGVELNTIAEAVHVVEETVSRMATAGPENNIDAILSLQNIDIIAQSLRAIANFSFSLSQTVPKEWQIDALTAANVVLLSDLAKRLSCSTRQISWGTINVEGDWELFD